MGRKWNLLTGSSLPWKTQERNCIWEVLSLKRLLVSHKTAEPTFRIPVLEGEPEISPSKSCSILYETGSAHLLLGPVMFPPPGCTLFIWLHWVLAVACGILVARPGTEPESPSLQGEFLSTGSHRAVPLQGALWLCIGSWLGSQVIPLISEVQTPSCSQSTLREKVSLGMQSWPRGCPPPLGWPFQGAGQDTAHGWEPCSRQAGRIRLFWATQASPLQYFLHFKTVG